MLYFALQSEEIKSQASSIDDLKNNLKKHKKQKLKDIDEKNLEIQKLEKRYENVKLQNISKVLNNYKFPKIFLAKYNLRKEI